MNNRKPAEFFLVRYVPDPIRNEFVNIGVVVREGSVDGARKTLLRFTRDWSRVRCIDPEVDTAMLEALEGEFQARLSEQEAAGTKPLLDVVSDSFSNLLQVTDAKGCLVESALTELENLMQTFVEPQKRRGPAKRTGRVALQGVLRTQFERARVWHLMQKKVPAALYTQAGDPLKVDCGYRPNGVIKMFHAVSLETDVELAKVLAFSAPQIKEGVARVEGAELLLTAIIEPLAELRKKDDDEDLVAQYRFGVETMEAQSIRVMTTNDLPRLAEAAQRELRVE